MKTSICLLIVVGVLCACQLSVAQDATPATDVKICTRSDDEQKECEFLAENMQSSDGLNWACVQVQDSKTFMDLIKEGMCNLITDLDAHELYDANKDFGFEPLLAEDYEGNGEGLSYYAIAVVPKETCEGPNGANLTINSLKGFKSCHTGYKKTSGWTIPLATIMGSEIAANGPYPEGTTDTDILTNFFPQMCAPGYRGDANDPAKDTMCSLCSGDCSSSPDNESYVGYEGSLRCLMDGAGEVAFMKHSTPLDFSKDGNDPQEWSSMEKASLRLVCPEGGCAEVEDYKNCNFARVPSHMIAGSSDLPSESIQNAFMETQKMPEFQNMFFGDEPSQMFKKGTQGLLPITTPTSDYLGKLGNVYSVLEENGF